MVSKLNSWTLTELLQWVYKLKHFMAQSLKQYGISPVTGWLCYLSEAAPCVKYEAALSGLGAANDHSLLTASAPSREDNYLRVIRNDHGKIIKRLQKTWHFQHLMMGWSIIINMDSLVCKSPSLIQVVRGWEDDLTEPVGGQNQNKRHKYPIEKWLPISMKIMTP